MRGGRPDPIVQYRRQQQHWRSQSGCHEGEIEHAIV